MVKFLFFEKATISCWSAKLGTRTLVSCMKLRCCISPFTPLLFVLLHKRHTTSWICTDSWHWTYIMRCRTIQYQCGCIIRTGWRTPTWRPFIILPTAAPGLSCPVYDTEMTSQIAFHRVSWYNNSMSYKDVSFLKAVYGGEILFGLQRIVFLQIGNEADRCAVSSSLQSKS